MKFLLLAFWALAVNPKNPSDACDRFIHEHDKKACHKKVNSPHIDWYASSFCETMATDEFFFGCFDKIQKAQFDPKAVQLCEDIAGDLDEAKFECLMTVKNKPLNQCANKADVKSLSACMKHSTSRLPATKNSDKAFYQKMKK